jgi:hypothetical protein
MGLVLLLYQMGWPGRAVAQQPVANGVRRAAHRVAPHLRALPASPGR